MTGCGPASLEVRPWEPRSLRVGDWLVTALSDGAMRLDGGGMWGVVPKGMWSRLTPAAEDNTIAIALRPFLARRGDVTAVIEVGVGDRWEDKWRSIYSLDRSTTLAASLRACGVDPEEVTHVFASHCHFDHVGAQVVSRDGDLFPLFPNARHLAHRAEVEAALNPDHVRRPSYRAEDVEPILRAGLLETYEGRAELAPGLVAHEAPGHSDGTSVLTINEDGEGQTAIFWSDVVPTMHHVQPSYIMAFDIDVTRSYTSRSDWIERACREGWIGLFYHDADHPFGRILRDGKRFAAEVVEGE